MQSDGPSDDERAILNELMGEGSGSEGGDEAGEASRPSGDDQPQGAGAKPGRRKRKVHSGCSERPRRAAPPGGKGPPQQTAL
jgi:hypothetical protein